MRIDDPEIRILAEISQALGAKPKKQKTVWTGSPFGWIKTRPSHSIGAITEKLVDQWLQIHGFTVANSPNSDQVRWFRDSTARKWN